MNKILLDGKGIYDASFAIEKLKTHNQEKWKESDYDALTNIIMAIVLWDNVCIFPEYCNSIYIDGVKYFNQYKNMFSVIKPKSGYVDLLPDDIKKLEEEYFFSPLETRELELYRTLEYSLSANLEGIDYMPSLERQYLLEKYNYMGFFHRKEVMEKIDNELKTYYEHVNSKLPVKNIKYSAPILLDYILDKGGIEDLINNAFELRENLMIVEFRKDMEQLEEAWVKGDIKYIDEYFSYLDLLIKKITGIIKTDRRINITISFPPALSFDITLRKKKKFHSIFLKDIVSYGIQRRKL